jgi:hypothetical protein
MTVVSKLKSSDPGIGAPMELVSSAWNPVGGGALAAGLRISKTVAHFVQRIFFAGAPANRASS